MNTLNNFRTSISSSTCHPREGGVALSPTEGAKSESSSLFEKKHTTELFVIPAKAGIQDKLCWTLFGSLDSRLRGNDIISPGRRQERTTSLLLFLIAMLCLPMLNAHINFGSKASAISVGDYSTFDVKSTANMEVDVGNIINQGFGVIKGKNINFSRGVYTFFNSVSDLDGVLDPDSNKIMLGEDLDSDGGTMIANPGGLASVTVRGLPGRSLLRGQPLLFGTNDLTLRDGTTGLSMAIQNTLNTNITLNSGLLFLQDDLRLGDDAVILDSGRVIFNNRRLSLGGKASTWNGRVIWDSARDLQLNSAVTLNGEWVFWNGEGQINGNGNVIDLANGGSISVLADSTLRLAGVHIKGLGATGTIKLAANAQLILTDVVIEMGDDYTFDSGTVLVEGSSTVITKDHILTFADSADGTTSGKLIVDRVALTYDTLATIDKLNIRPALINDPDRKHIDVIGNGEVRTIRQDTATFHNYRSSPVLLKYAVIAPYRKFVVFPEVGDLGEQIFDVSIDGNTNFLSFTRTDEQIFIVTQGVHATTTNIVMRDFSPKHVGLEAGASLVFGDKTTMTFSFSQNEYLNYPWVFEGEAIMRGGGGIFELGPNGVIEVRGQNSVLLIDGVIFKGIAGTKIRCSDPTCKIILKNVKWVQSGDFNYATGGLEILDDVSMFGPHNFIYQSDQVFKILSYATMSLIRDMIFTYAPAGGASNLFQFQDTAAALMLDQATLAATSGMQLSGGRLIVRNRNFLLGSVTIGTDMVVDRPAGATLEQRAG